MNIKRVKILGLGEALPNEAKYFCNDCRMWCKTRGTVLNHHREFPSHTIRNVETGLSLEYGRGKYTRNRTAPNLAYRKAQVNGNALLNASARDLLLDYVLAKAKEELNSELDRMFRELKSQPTQRSAALPRKTFVAR